MSGLLSVIVTHIRIHSGGNNAIFHLMGDCVNMPPRCSHAVVLRPFWPFGKSLVRSKELAPESYDPFLIHIFSKHSAVLMSTNVLL